MAAAETRQVTFGVGVSVDGADVSFDEDMRPFIMDGRTFLPVRAIADIAGMDVDFDGDANTVILTTGANPQAVSSSAQIAPATVIETRQVTFGVAVSVDGEIIDFDDDMRPFIMDGRTFLPVRAIADIAYMDVDFDGDTNTVVLTTQTAVAAAPSPTPSPTPTPAPTPSPTPAPPATLHGRWYYAGEPTFVFNANGSGRVIEPLFGDMNIRWSHAGSRLFICVTPEICGRSCPSPVIFNYTLSGSGLTLTESGEPPIVLQRSNLTSQTTTAAAPTPTPRPTPTPAASRTPTNVREYFEAFPNELRDLTNEMNSTFRHIAGDLGADIRVNTEIQGNHTLVMNFVFNRGTHFVANVEVLLQAELDAMAATFIELAQAVRRDMRVNTLYIQIRYIDGYDRVLAESTFAGH